MTAPCSLCYIALASVSDADTDRIIVGAFSGTLQRHHTAHRQMIRNWMFRESKFAQIPMSDLFESTCTGLCQSMWRRSEQIRRRVLEVEERYARPLKNLSGIFSHRGKSLPALNSVFLRSAVRSLAASSPIAWLLPYIHLHLRLDYVNSGLFRYRKPELQLFALCKTDMLTSEALMC